MKTPELSTTSRLETTLAKPGKLLSIYFTAGYPSLEDTVPIIKKLEEAGADMVEIGLPFSDPLADGPVIQDSSTQALKNGMNTRLLFQQIRYIREQVKLPLVIMGYFNPILQFGVEAFCAACAAAGIDGLILPDLPLDIYEKDYKSIMEAHGLSVIFLITPQTSDERIRQIDDASTSFIYMVSSASTTGVQSEFGKGRDAYFIRIADLNLKHPQLVGFGISDAASFKRATTYAKGAIIGSGFIRMLADTGIDGIADYIKAIR